MEEEYDAEESPQPFGRTMGLGGGARPDFDLSNDSCVRVWWSRSVRASFTG